MQSKLTEQQQKIQQAALINAIGIAGSSQQLADILNEYVNGEGRRLNSQNIRDWKRYGIPVHWVLPIHYETGVSLTELQPLLYPKGLIVK